MMAAGFTHGVLNTDNMSLAGESFDYGPFAFLDRWDPGFTAAYFDHSGLYAFGQQPLICHHNLRLLQEPLAMLLPRAELEARLERFAPTYDAHYRHGLLRLRGWPKHRPARPPVATGGEPPGCRGASSAARLRRRLPSVRLHGGRRGGEPTGGAPLGAP